MTRNKVHVVAQGGVGYFTDGVTKAMFSESISFKGMYNMGAFTTKCPSNFN